MLNIGIDFGSTYTVVSAYQSETGKLEPVILELSTPYVPSVVASRDGNMDSLRFGTAAKNAAGRKGIHTYKAFKMLLGESDDSTFLEKRGYTKECAPAVIAEKFLNDLIRRVLDHYGERTIESLAIGAPEIWFNELSPVSGRNLLKEICSRMECVKKVEVRSEPAAASAYFAYNYERICKKAFEGYILLIDYGGGTLDITLSKVSASEKENGHQLMEINIKDRQGAGENEEGHIGKAGIAYMESLMEEALRRNGLLEQNTAVKVDEKFYRAVNELESEIKSRTGEISSVFQEIGTDALDELEEEEFTSIEYEGEDVEITYALMVEIYDREIRDVLQENLEKSIRFMKKEDIPYQDQLGENFKIALAGGFGNFYLVRKQVEETFVFSSVDKRQTDIIVNRSDCENAISLGMALLASGVIGIRHTAPYSVGMPYRDISGKYRMNYAIHHRQELEEDQLYYQRKANGRLVPFIISESSFRGLMVDRGGENGGAVLVPYKEPIRRKLESAANVGYELAAIAFSLDRADVLSVYIGEYDPDTGQAGKMERFELADYEEMFDSSRSTRFSEL